MAAPDWLAYWGSGLSTLLAVREIHKHRRSTRPKLVAFLSQPADGYRLEVHSGGEEAHGQAHAVMLHNRGGVPTTVTTAELRIGVRWLPAWMLTFLGELGFAPVTKEGRGENFALGRRLAPDPTPAGGETSVRVVLWDEHREALRTGRLYLNVVHSWHRDRPQQIRIRMSVDGH